MFWLRDSKSNADWKVGQGSKLPNVRGQVRRKIFARSGDPGDGEIIDKPRTKAGNFAAAARSGRRGNKKNSVQTRGADLPADLTRLGRRKVGDNQPSEPGRPRIREEFLRSVTKN